MLDKRKKKGGGGKLTRSETVTVRLDPKLRYLAELGARKQRRTLSSYIEWAIEESLNHVALEHIEGGDLTISNRSDLWDVDEADRFVNLAFSYPDLLTHEEQVLWKLICENGSLWRGRYSEEGQWTWLVEFKNIEFDRLREDWERFIRVAAGEADRKTLPTWAKHKDDWPTHTISHPPTFKISIPKDDGDTKA